MYIKKKKTKQEQKKVLKNKNSTFFIYMAYLKVGSDKMAYKEIVTKAVIGKAKKKYKNTYEITIEEKPSTILGCWIINHTFKGEVKDNKVIVIRRQQHNLEEVSCQYYYKESLNSNKDDYYSLVPTEYWLNSRYFLNMYL